MATDRSIAAAFQREGQLVPSDFVELASVTDGEQRAAFDKMTLGEATKIVRILDAELADATKRNEALRKMRNSIVQHVKREVED